MRELIPSWIRIPVAFILITWATEYFAGSGKAGYALLEQPVLLLFLALALLFLIILEIVLDAIETIMFKTLPQEAKVQFLKEREERLKPYRWTTIYQRLLNPQPPSKERDLELDHNYDGIKELDNALPPWWLYSFYASIIFAAGYLVYYEIMDGDGQYAEYEQEMAQAKIALEEYKKNAPDLVDAESVTLLTQASDLEAGAQLYQTNCMACHAGDGGGGIGPNLVDEHWILGGGVKNIFQVISEGGRAGKGMISWKSILKPTEIQQLASYIVSLEGTETANPKAPEGDIWIAE